MTKVIAEIGINHNGSIKEAKQLIDDAKSSGCWGVKFQYRNIDNFYNNADELGDEMIQRELFNNYLSPEKINSLCSYAKEIGLSTGISFFRMDDVKHYGDLTHFDFMKVPSAECTNTILIDHLLSLSDNVIVSVGGHTEHDIINHLLPYKNKITVLHCVSNYPTRLGWQNLSYISRLKEIGFESVGYSSHDEDIEVCLMALTYEPEYVERHITLNRNSLGLDHSTSSEKSDFVKLSKYINNLSGILRQDKNSPNQGEILNIQNLGTGLYAKRELQVGTVPTLDDFEIRAPRKGISSKNFISQKLTKLVDKHSALEYNHYLDTVYLSDNAIDVARKHNIGIPVRYHDYVKLSNRLPLNLYELHMSSNDVDIDHDDILRILSSDHKFSIHLPDYLPRSTELINPLSDDQMIRQTSNNIISRIVELANKIQCKTGYEIPIVGSFPIELSVGKTQTMDYLFDYLSRLDTKILPQWLPSWGWYFGGAYNITMFSDLTAIEYIENNNVDICVDVCHLILSCNNNGLDWKECHGRLKHYSKHYHLADAIGVDGEGVKMGEGDINKSDISHIMNHEQYNILEVWQGHLNTGQGFIHEINYITENL